MTSEEMRERIAAELEAGRPPLGDLVGQAVAEGRRKQRRVRLGAIAVSTDGVLAVACADAQFAPAFSKTAVTAGGGTGSPTHSAAKPPAITASATAPTSTPHPSEPTTPTSAASTPLSFSPIVKHVDPATIPLDKGYYLNFATDSMSWWAYEGGLTVQYNGKNTWGSDFVSMGGDGGRLVSGMYVGDKDIAAAAVTIDGKQYPATVVKVNGAHGWCGVYLLRPPGQTSWNSILVDVYDSTGTVVATTGVGINLPPDPKPTGLTGPRTLPMTNIPINTPFAGATVSVPPNSDANGKEPGKP
jgi:hypothetical protein